MDDAKCYYPKGEGDLLQGTAIISPGQFEKIATAKGPGSCTQFSTPMYGSPNVNSVGCFKRQDPKEAIYTGADQNLCVGASKAGKHLFAGCLDLSSLTQVSRQIYTGFAWKVTGSFRFEKSMSVHNLADREFQWCMGTQPGVNVGRLFVDGMQTLDIGLDGGAHCTSLFPFPATDKVVSIQAEGLFVKDASNVLLTTVWIRIYGWTEANRDLPVKGFQPEA